MVAQARAVILLESALATGANSMSHPTQVISIELRSMVYTVTI